MITKKTKLICLFLVILFISLATVSATDNSNTNNQTTDTITDHTTTTSQSNIITQDKTVNDNSKNKKTEYNNINTTNNTKSINKKDTTTYTKTATTFSQVYATHGGDASVNGQDINNPTTFYHALQIIGQNGVIKFVNRDEDVKYEFKSPISINDVVLSQGTTKFTITVSDPDSGHKLIFDGLNQSQLFVIEDGYDIKFQYVNFEDSNATGDKGTVNGGAIFAVNSNITFQSCNFTNTHAVGNGGSIFLSGGTINFAWDNVFTNCTSKSNGGALFLAGTGYTKLHNLTFVNCNASTHGGTIFGTGAYFDIDMNHFINSTSGVDGGTFYINGDLKLHNSDVDRSYAGRDGGLIHIENGTLYFGLLTLTDNHAGRDGGAVYGTNITFNHTSNIYFYNNTAGRDGGVFYFNNVTTNKGVVTTANNNSAGRYGGIYYISNTNFTLQNLDSNISNATFGGVLYALNSTINMQTANINNSNASRDGGIIYCENTNFTSLSNFRTINSTAVNGGAMYFLNSTATVSNGASFTNSKAEENGGMIYCENSTYHSSGNVPYVNGTAGNNGGAIYATANSEVSLNETPLNTNTAGNNGGGIYVDESTLYIHINAAPGVANNTALNGGAVYATKSNVTINSSSIADNKATGTETGSGLGGGVYADECIINITGGPTIRSNRANNGGGLYITNSNASVAASIIANNATNKTEDPLNESGLGGGVYVAYSNISFVGSGQFTSNTASDGGAIYALYSDLSGFAGAGGAHHVSRNGGLVYLSYSNLTLANNNFNGGTAGANGGSFYVDHGNLTLNHVSLSDNKAGANGGAIYSVNGTVTIDGAQSGANVANGSGGFIYAIGEQNNLTLNHYGININNATEKGGAIYNDEGSLNIYNSAFQANFANQTGGAIYNNGKVTSQNLTFRNNHGTEGGAIYNDENSTFILDNFYLEYNNANVSGGAINNIGNMSIYDGALVGSWTDANASTIYNNGYLNATAFAITNSYGRGEGGYGSVYNDVNGTVIFTGFAASNNINTYAGFLYNEGNTSLEYGIIENNTGHFGAGGIFNNHGGNISVNGVNIQNNTIDYYPRITGGQIYNNESNINIEYSFVGNDSKRNFEWTPIDAAIINTNNANMTISHSDVAYNSNRAIFNEENSTVIINHSNIYENNATEGLDGEDLKGAAIYNRATLIIANSSYFYNNNAAEKGGAIYEQSSSYGEGENIVIKLTNTTITDSFFRNNTAKNGGALYEDVNCWLEYSNLTIDNASFQDNTAAEDGGAIATSNSPMNINLVNSEFNNNTAKNGGAINLHNEWDTVIFENNTFTNNTATENGGALYIHNNTQLNSNNDMFINNSANGNGGAIENKGILNVENGEFDNNKATNGGAIENERDLNVEKSKFTNNNATENGGAIRDYTYSIWTESGTIATSTVTSIKDSVFINNTATNGGAIDENHNAESLYGGESSNSLHVDNTSFINNSATNGGAIRETYQAWDSLDSSLDTLIKNSEFINNTAENGGAIFEDLSNNWKQDNPSKVIIENTTFNYNNATTGGAISIIREKANPVNIAVSDSSFNNNNATGNGGAIYNDATITIDSSSLDNNTAHNGGAAYTTENGTTIITGSNLTNNYAFDGGLIYNKGSLNLSDSYVANNTAGDAENHNYVIINYGVDNTYFAVTGNYFYNNTANYDGDYRDMLMENYGSNKILVNNNLYYDNYLETSFDSIYIDENQKLLFSTMKLRDIYNDTVVSGDVLTNITPEGQTSVKVSEHSPEEYSVSVLNLSKLIDDGEISLDEIYDAFYSLSYTTYNIETEAPNKNYQNASIEGLTLLKSKKTTISVSANDTVVLNGSFVNGTLIDEDGVGIANARVNLTFNNGTFSTVVITDENGNFNYTFITNVTGVNNVTALFKGNGAYTTSNDETTFNVVPRNSTVTVSAIEPVFVGNDTVISGVLVDQYGDVIGNAPINITVNNGTHTVVFNTVTDAEGKYNVTYKTVYGGVNNVTAVYVGNSTYNPTRANNTFTVDKLDTSITVGANESVKVTKNVTINGTLVDQDGKFVPNANITVIVNNNTVIVTTTDAEGKYSVNYTTNVTGKNNVTVKFDGNDTYNPTNNTTTFNVEKLDTKILLDQPDDTVFHTNTTITGILLDEFDRQIQFADVTLTLPNGTNVTVRTDKNGKFNHTLYNAVPGLVNVTATYAGNDTYNGNNTTKHYIVNPLDTVVTVNATSPVKITKNTTVSGVLKDVNGDVIAFANITVTINSKPYNKTTDKNGKYEIPYTASMIGTNYLTVDYKGNDSYKPTYNENTFEVVPLNTTTTISNIPDVLPGTTVNVKGTVKDEYGNLMPDANIIIIINENMIIPSKTDGNGAYNIEYTPTKPGSLVAMTIFVGNSTHNQSNNVTRATVKKTNVTVTVDSVKNTTINNKTDITGKVTDEYGNPLPDTNVTITLPDGTNITTKTNNKGEYNSTIDNKITGNVTVKVEFKGNSTHEASTATTTYNVRKYNVSVTVSATSPIKISKNTTITGTLRDETGKVIPNGGLVLSVDDVKFNVTTDKNGNYKLDYTTDNLDKAVVTVWFKGDNVYNSAFNMTTFKVLPLTTTTTVNKISDVTPDTKVTITGNVKDEFGRLMANADVKIIVSDNEIINTKTNNNGQYSIVYTNTSSEAHKSVTPVYMGNSTHLSSLATTGFNIRKINSKITVNVPEEVTAGKPMNITGKLTDEAGKPIVNKKVIVNVNGTEITVTTDNNGNYKATYTPTQAGTLPVSVTYPGDNTYNPANATGKNAIVKRMNTSITINPIKDTAIGNKSNVSGKLTDEDGKPLANVPVTVTLPDGSTISTRTNNKGVYNVIIDNDVVGNVTVKAEVKGNSSHAGSVMEFVYNVRKLNTIVSVESIKGIVGEKITLVASVTDEYGNPVSGGNLVFKLNGITLKTDGRFDTNKAPLKIHVDNGKVTFTITADLYLRNTKNITASYSGSYKYNANKSKVAQAQIQLRYMNIKVKVSPKVAKQYQTVTFTATVSDVTKKATNKTIINQDAYVIFKINGNSLKDKNGNIIYTKVVNKTATLKYTIPRGTAGLWSGTLNTRKYEVEVVYANDNFYPVNNKNTTSYGVERSPVNITFKETKIVNHYLSIKATLKDLKGKNLLGTNKICLKINGKTYSINNETMYYYVKDGAVSINGIYIDNPAKITSVGIVTGDREAYLPARATTKKIVKS